MTRTENERADVPGQRDDALSVNDPVVVQALQEYRAAQQAGQVPQRQQLLTRFPQIAAELSACLEALDFVAAAAAQLHSAGLAAGAAPEEDCQGQPLGDYRILREVGRGGMGVVYEAEQLSLGRRVALKVLPLAAALDARQLQRFKNEAQAAAHLQHQHIVPVYAVGCERGVHYYAMQFVDGHTLASLIQQMRERQGCPAAPEATGPYRLLPEAGRPAVETATPPLAAASTQLSSGDPAFFRTVARLGVQAAEALEHAHQLGVVHRDVKPANLMVDGRGNLWITDFGLAHCQSQAGLTMSGDLIGTLRYMSPEQALAQRVAVDHRTDIYSLGVTLYELLTLEPIFAGGDRQELLRQIAFEEPRPPRRLNKAIAAELETIVLKAMEKNPAERYNTAQELADDLERWLKDEPIRARRPSVVQRLRRWGRRHRAMVWAAAACLLVAGAVLAGSVGWVLRDEAVRWAETERKGREALQEATALQGKGKYPEALAAARHAKELLADGGTKEFQQRVGGMLADLSMVVRLEEICLEQTNVREAGFDIARADPEYTRAFQEFGIDVEALGPEEAAARIRARTIPVELAAALDLWAGVRKLTRKGDAQSWKRLVAVARLADPDERRNQLREALERRDDEALVHLAASKQVTDWPASTLVLLSRALLQTSAAEQAVALLRKAQQRHPGDFWINHELALSFSQLKPPQLDEASRFLTAAVAIRPQSPGAHVNLGVALAGKGRLDEAITALHEAIRLEPAYVSAHYNLGVTLTEKRQWDAAITAYQEAIRLMPDMVPAHYNLGIALMKKGWPDAAIAAYRKAIHHKPDWIPAHGNLGIALMARGELDAAIAEFREVIRLEKDLAVSHYNLGTALSEKGRLEEAIAEFREAIRLRPGFAAAHYNLGRALARKGQLDAAIASYQKAIHHKPGHALAHYDLGVALAEKGEHDAAIASYQKAIHHKPDFALAHYNLGVVLAEKGQHDPAIASYRKAIHHKPDYADAYYNLGRSLSRRMQLDAAIAAYRQAITHKPDLAEAHCNLGVLLGSRGQLTDALTALRRGHALGSRNPKWRYPSARWVRECEGLVAHERQLAPILTGAAEPADADAAIAFARVCALKRLNGAAARLYDGAFAARPELASNRAAGHRYRAACAAAQAGCGEGADGATLDAAGRARWRRQALTWLRADLAAWARLLKGGTPPARIQAQQALERWQHASDLAGLRDAKPLAQLPQAEQEACRRLWADWQALLRPPHRKDPP
jgi:tetratricopeptide (TPR) repeat protein